MCGGRRSLPAHPPPASVHLLTELCSWPPPSALGLVGSLASTSSQKSGWLKNHPKMSLERKQHPFLCREDFLHREGEVAVEFHPKTAADDVFFESVPKSVCRTRAWEYCKPWDGELFSELAMGKQEDQSAGGQEAGRSPPQPCSCPDSPRNSGRGAEPLLSSLLALSWGSNSLDLPHSLLGAHFNDLVGCAQGESAWWDGAGSSSTTPARNDTQIR